MKIGLDFDGVIANSGKFKSDNLKRLFGNDIPIAKLRKNLILEGKCPDISPEQYEEVKHLGWETDAGLNMEPVNGALLHIHRLIADRHELTVITSRRKPALKIAEEWMSIRGLRLNIVGVNNGSKATAAAGLDVFVEDDLHKLEPLVGVVQHRFLFSWGYNEHLNIGSIARRISSWEEIYQIVTSLA